MRKRLKLHGIVSFVTVIVSFLLVSGIGLTGYGYYAVQKEQGKQTWGNGLSAISDLKVNEIARWRGERLADAYSIIDTPFIAHLAKECFDGPLPSRPVQEVLKWMRTYQNRFDYFSISLLDLDGNVRLSVPEGEQTDDDVRQHVSEIALTKKPFICDLERSEIVRDIHLDLIIPLHLSTTEHGNSLPVGAVLIRINPDKFLYPLIQSWPTPSPTAETLLVRREGDEVVFLNKLRHMDNTPLALRLPIQGPKAPCAAGDRPEGVSECVDYRGAPVFAVVRPIPDTPWLLIAKIDAEEVYAPLRARALLLTFLAALLVASAAVSVGLVWSHQRSKLYLKQYRTEAEKLELARRYEHLARNANDIILLADADGKVVEGNQRAVTAYGYSPEEIVGLNVSNLETPGVSGFEERMRLAGNQDGFVFETMHRRKQGGEFPVEVSARAVEQSGKSQYMMIIRDITERKQAEQSLKEAHNSLEQRVRQRTADLQSVTTRLAETEESERRRVARELHDRVGQSLTVLNINLTVALNGLPADSPPDVSNRLEDSLNLVSDTMSCVRNVMADLRPPLLDDHGLAMVLSWHCREFAERSGIETVVKCAEQIPRLPPSEEIALFRIAQEALMNVMRHARASRVTVELEAGDKSVRMCISDNGVGFHPEPAGDAQPGRSSWGMLSMRERAEMVGGRLQVDSRPGGGTRITVDVKR